MNNLKGWNLMRSYLVSQLRLEHFCVLRLLDVGPGHLLKSLVSDLESLSQVQSQSLGPIGENVECHLHNIM